MNKSRKDSLWPRHLRMIMLDEKLKEQNEENMQTEVVQKTLFERLTEKIPEIDYKAGLFTCGGEKEFFLILFNDFTEMPIREELEQLLMAGDYKNYCVRIHGFKTSAYSMGATELGDLAYEMEKLTKEEIPEEIPAMQEKLLNLYEDICARYREIL